MTLRIISDDADDLSDPMREAIESTIEGAVVEVRAKSPRHYEIAVTAEAFRGQPRVAQQQRVYAAIMQFLTGDDPPVHAIDRMQTLVP